MKSSGVATTLAPGGATMAGIGPAGTLNIINIGGGGGKMMDTTMEFDNMKPTPPWLRAPRTYKPKGKFARKFVVTTTSTTTTIPPSRCMPIMPMTESSSSSAKSKHGTTKSKRKSDLTSTTATAVASDGIPRTESALEQLARTASGERLLFLHRLY